jgi:hypothetical protein
MSELRLHLPIPSGKGCYIGVVASTSLSDRWVRSARLSAADRRGPLLTFYSETPFVLKNFASRRPLQIRLVKRSVAGSAPFPPRVAESFARSARQMPHVGASGGIKAVDPAARSRLNWSAALARKSIRGYCGEKSSICVGVPRLPF